MTERIMSQLAPQGAHAVASSASLAASASNMTTTSAQPPLSPGSGSNPSSFDDLARARSPPALTIVDSPTTGRHQFHPQHQHQPQHRSKVAALALPSVSSARSPRPHISSPLSSASSSQTYGLSSPRSATFSLHQTPLPSGQPTTDNPIPKASFDGPTHTSFYSDSSDSGSPEPRTPRLGFSDHPNDARSVSDPITSKPPKGSISPMAGPVPAAPGEPSKGQPRNSSLGSAISAFAAKSQSPNSAPDAQSQSPDISSLIKTAGSPEALIQFLLKEKHSQSQQNSQLWRLVDKQRAMILGLNKDLERALKEKEKYRKKLKEVMALPAVSRAAGAQGSTPTQPQAAGIPQVGLERTKEQLVIPDSPTLDSDSQRESPIDTAAPFPITPPADLPSGAPAREEASSATQQPKSQAKQTSTVDTDMDEGLDRIRKDRIEDRQKALRRISLSNPPSRSLPSEPPKMPPPKPPTGHLPTVAIVEATPQPDEGLGHFPAPPPRKAPPAPLQLIQDRRPGVPEPTEDEDTDSDYDDILEVDEILDDRRGRRRTREEDERDREIIALKEAAARSASKKSKSSNASQPSSPRDDTYLHPGTVAPSLLPESNTAPASLSEVLSGKKPREIPAPLRSPGLPASPRPMNMAAPLSPPPLSPRGVGVFHAPPLSPRPPRQPIPMPPNMAPVTTAAPVVALGDNSPTSPRRQDAVREAALALDDGSRMSSPTERTEVYRGLVTEEYPELLLPPNALPSIEVKVASSRMKPSRASMLALMQLEEDPVFTLAVISRAEGGELWRVEKDLNALYKLDQRLRLFASFTARIPERSLFSGHAPAKLDTRRSALNQYMNDLLNTPFDTATALEVCKYLSGNVLPPNLDDAGLGGGDTGSENSGNRVNADGRPLRSGYLTKRGKNFGGWKARFFVLDSPQFKYYETPGGVHLGTIKLQNAQVVKKPQGNDVQSPTRGAPGEANDDQFRHAFIILEPKKKDSTSHVKHVLCAESDRERDFWVNALVQWTDYRDPEDEAPAAKPSAPPPQTPATPGPDRSGGNKIKKPSAKPHHQLSDSDTLIGVRYDAVQAGDAPQLVATRPKTSGGPADHHGHGFDAFSAQASKFISGPKDPHIISDSAAWGNKPGLAIPTTEEKKQRKRSFFGFGPKTRSSSDGQDSMFSTSEGAGGSAPQHHPYQGPAKHVFGAPLAEAVRYSAPLDVNVPLPAVVYRCIQYLDEKHAVLEEGIFRLSGSNVVIKQLRERFNNEGDVNLTTDRQYYDIHAVASLLKLYLRELPTSILTPQLHMEFLAATTDVEDREDKVDALNILVQKLPQANATLLKYLIGFLIKIINNADMNKMTVRNVGIVFSPTLNIPAPVFAMFLQNYEGIFGVDPEVYELPSPVSEPELHNPFTDMPPRFDLPARPSTSGSGSSYAHGRVESIRDFSRSTPTPPLMYNHPGARASPPASARSATYDIPHAAPGAMRSGSDAGLASSGYDTHNMPPPSRGAPAYERPSHSPQSSEGRLSPGGDQSFANSRRRESAIFMGGVMGPQYQGSKSRLREETRF